MSTMNQPIQIDVNKLDAENFQKYLQTVIGGFPPETNAPDLRAFEQQIKESQGDDSSSSGSYDDCFDDNSTIATTFTLLQQQFKEGQNVKLEGLGGVRHGDESEDEEECTQAWEKMDKSDLIELLKAMRFEQATKKSAKKEEAKKKEKKEKELKKETLDVQSIRIGLDMEDYSVQLPPWAQPKTAKDQQKVADAIEAVKAKEEIAKAKEDAAKPKPAAVQPKQETEKKEITELDVDEFAVRLPPWFHQANFQKEESQKKLIKEESQKQMEAGKSEVAEGNSVSSQQEEAYNVPSMLNPTPAEKKSASAPPSTRKVPGSKRKKKGVSFPSLKPLTRGSLFRRSSSRRKKEDKKAAEKAEVEQQAAPPAQAAIPAVPQNIQSMLHSTPQHRPSREGSFMPYTAGPTSRLAAINAAWRQAYDGSSFRSGGSKSTNRSATSRSQSVTSMSASGISAASKSSSIPSTRWSARKNASASVISGNSYSTAASSSSTLEL